MSAFYDYSGGGRFPQYRDFRPGGTGVNDYGETYEELLRRLLLGGPMPVRLPRTSQEAVRGTPAPVEVSEEPSAGAGPQEWAQWLYDNGVTRPGGRDALRRQALRLGAQRYPGKSTIGAAVARAHRQVCADAARERSKLAYAEGFGVRP
ncbi:hypothetical protein [Streptomyces albireticuli]|uniref:Uncharacterized protein n=1 Tax=Streptomyces albireticuli TaxID=1940 RepID=A0A2A2DEX8_9ACTN|nr:hypothetical protein [Streptomyces albireticuli]MCD9143453.1 hypothetical protein [Streptomyces albireticuli]MCD9164812.1 hypothetical protein [Streptomyces albireticuli]MCD9191570.1 hypothetical protein [Streptomyces albireticuli]PAU50051.1 hypothetical protein CK936_04550 [Streptomyces albireticuli]